MRCSDAGRFRVGSIVVIGAPVMATMAWRLLRAVVSAKLVARVKFCNETLPLEEASDEARACMRAELTAMGVDASTLPRDLGGSDTASDETSWVSRLEVDESNLVTLRATKLASVERLGAKVDPDNKFKVLTVTADSFSATLGLQVDDWIVKFNGADVMAVTDLKLRANEEYAVEVVVLRPDRAFNLTDVQ
jgi:C-terminal processing protease CtpA/Prc